MRARVLWCLFVLSLVTSTALATDGTLSWSYQQTGFQTVSSGSGVQTTLAIRDGKAWPVIFSYDKKSPYVAAYSLYPVSNVSNPVSNPMLLSSPYSNWHQIGGGLLATGGSNRILSAATSPDGRIGVVARSPNNSYPDYESAAVIGGTTTGWGAAMSGVRAIDFNAQGGLVKGTLATIPPSTSYLSPGPLVDIAVSPTGEMGAIDGMGNYYQKMAWTGEWAKMFQPNPIAIQTADLAMDSLGRPHVVGATGAGLVTSDFNVMSGQWTSQTLSSIPSVFGATVAADDLGGVGAAWVQSVGGDSGKLMYAYKKDALSGWATHEVTTGFSSSDLVTSNQRVGLAYDANDFPVISFVAGSNKNIWLAYDPPAAVPEPSSLVLLAAGGMLMLLVAGKSRVRRLLGK